MCPNPICFSFTPDTPCTTNTTGATDPEEEGILGGAPGELAHGGAVPRTYSPLASSSQISKKTIRSYLHWQGPALGRVMVLSLVAGTAAGGEGGLNVEAGCCSWSLEPHTQQQEGEGRAGTGQELGSDRQSHQAGQQQGRRQCRGGHTPVQGDTAPSWGPRWPPCASSHSQSRAARVQDGASPGDTQPSPAAPGGAGTGPKPHSTAPAPGEQLVDSRRGAAGTYPSVPERDAGRHHSKPLHSAEPERLGSQQPEAGETRPAPARAASGAPGTACPRGWLRQETRGAAGPAAAPCGHEPGFCAFPTARSVAGRGGGQAGSSAPCRRREVAAVAAASTCPESVSRSKPARAAGTEQPLSRRGLVCSWGFGREGDKRRGRHKAKRLHTDTWHEGGGPRGCREHRGKSTCKGVCASCTWSERVLKGLWVLCPSGPALQAHGKRAQGAGCSRGPGLQPGDCRRGAGRGLLPGLESGITRGKWRRDGLSGLQRERAWMKAPAAGTGFGGPKSSPGLPSSAPL